MRLNFVTVDVFTDRQFGGNPLAVVLDGNELTTEQMQAIAAEFNLAETTFVLPPKDEKHTAEVRIFTPRAELPFAGHPNIGTAFALSMAGASYGRPLSEPFVFEEKAGLVPVDIVKSGGRAIGAMLSTPQTLSIGARIPPEAIADACGLSVSDIQLRSHVPHVVSCGVPFVVAELKSVGALNAAAPRSEAFARDVPMGLATGIFLYVPSDEDGRVINARMFAPLYGIPEDPATGSGIAALAGFLASLKSEPKVEIERRIVQGEKMGRRSIIHARATKIDGKLNSIRIGGNCIAMSRGVLDLLDRRSSADPTAAEIVWK